MVSQGIQHLVSLRQVHFGNTVRLAEQASIDGVHVTVGLSTQSDGQVLPTSRLLGYIAHYVTKPTKARSQAELELWRKVLEACYGVAYHLNGNGNGMTMVC